MGSEKCESTRFGGHHYSGHGRLCTTTLAWVSNMTCKRIVQSSGKLVPMSECIKIIIITASVGALVYCWLAYASEDEGSN